MENYWQCHTLLPSSLDTCRNPDTWICKMQKGYYIFKFPQKIFKKSFIWHIKNLRALCYKRSNWSSYLRMFFFFLLQNSWFLVFPPPLAPSNEVKIYFKTCYNEEERFILWMWCIIISMNWMAIKRFKMTFIAIFKIKGLLTSV